MTVAFRASATADGTASGTPIVIPSLCQTGDLAIIGIGVVSGTPAAITTPAGWALVTGTTVQQDTAFTVGYYYKVLTSGDPGSTLTLAYTGVTGVAMNAILVAYSGAAATLPFDAVALVHDLNANAHACPAVTPVSGTEMVFAIELERASSHATAYTVSAGATIRASDLPAGTGSAISQGCAVDSGAPVASGTLSGGWTITSTATSSAHTYILAAGILPAATIQVVRPLSDVTVASWVQVGAGSTFAAVLSDSDDTTYAESSAAPAGLTIEEKLATPGAALASVTVRARISGGATSGSMVVSLVENTTVLQSWTQAGLTTSFTGYIFTVTGTGLSGQTDLTNLRVRVAVTAS